jgi:hypothetical protein
MLFYLWIEGHSNFIQFHYRLIVHLIVHQTPLNFYVIYNGFNLTTFNELSNDDEIT